MIRRLSLFSAIWLLTAPLARAQVLYSGKADPNALTNVPSNSIGIDNAWYLDLLTGNVYGPKILGKWPPTPITQLANGGANTNITSNGSAVFYARAFGSCTWDATHDVSPCVNAAIAAATAIGGGDVIVPSGEFGQASTVAISTSGVSLNGRGIGDLTPSGFTVQTGTQFDWIGACGAGTQMLNVAPTGNYSLKGVNVDGIVWNANNCANIAARASHFTNSAVHLAGVNALMENVWATTEDISAGPGAQDNDLWVWSYSNSAVNKPTGALFDGQGSTWNVSVNRIHVLNVYYNLGDGVVLGFSDNNLFDSVRTFPVFPTTSPGNPLVLAAKNYVMPNGQTVAQGAPTNGNIFLHASAKSTWVQGLASNATVAAGGGNVCTGCGPTTVALTTISHSALDAYTLFFSSTTGLAPYELLNCGGTFSGVQTGSPIAKVVDSNTVTLSNSTLNTGSVVAGLACTASFGATNTAVKGAYTITATAASTVNVTAPTGGTSQTGLSTASGTLTAADLVIPWAAGTMTAGDTWTVTLTKAAYSNVILGMDRTNGTPMPTAGAGTTGGYSLNSDPTIQPFGLTTAITKVTLSQSPYFWNPEPTTNPLIAFLVGGGGGGGGGPRQGTGLACSGGAGGGAGAYQLLNIAPSMIPHTATFTIGAGGTWGAGASSDSSAGSAGTNGGATTLGSVGVTWGTANGGGGGDGGRLALNSAGGGGAGLLGTATAGSGSTPGAAGTGGTAGGLGGTSTAISSYTGGGTGGAGGANGAVGNISGANLFGPTGGGSGGGIDASNVAYAGGNAGYANAGPYANGPGGAVGQNGSNGASPSAAPGYAGSGGGGGGADLAAAGNGGAGTAGGGGGGGGCVRNGGTAGNGGNGGDGFAIIMRN